MRKLVLAIIAVVLLTLFIEVYYGYRNGTVYLSWLDYNALPFILSVLVFVFTRQLRVPDSGGWKILVKSAPYTFGVYLIHDHLSIRSRLWDMVALPSQCDQWQYPLVVLGLCVLIFVVCACIDAVRKKLFAVLQIDRYIAKIDKWSIYS